MSFFGFDTTLPGEGKKPSSSSKKTNKKSHSNSKNMSRSQPPKQQDDELMDQYSKIDEMLEEKFKYGDVGLEGDMDGLALQEDDEGLNDETFGGSLDPTSIRDDFDFTSGNNVLSHEKSSHVSEQRKPSLKELWSPPTAHSTQPGFQPGPPPTDSAVIWGQFNAKSKQYPPAAAGMGAPPARPPAQPMSLAEIEAAMIRNAKAQHMPPGYPPQHMPPSVPPPGYPHHMMHPGMMPTHAPTAPAGKAMSLEQVEAAMMMRKAQPIPPPSATPTETPNQVEQVVELAEEEKDPDSFMSQHEKELIAKIQISQLISEDPFVDDFYYKIHQLLLNPQAPSTQSNTKATDKSQNWQQQLLSNKDGKMNVENTMEAQMQRLIEGRRKERPKGTSLKLEGALGKIALGSSKNPRQILSFKVSAPATDKGPDSTSAAAATIVSPFKVLMSVEKLYNFVLNLEHLQRKLTGVAKDKDAERVDEDGNTLSEEEIQAMRKEEYETNIQAILSILHIQETVPFDVPHPLTHILHYSKGKKVIPRLMPFLNPDAQLSLLSTILSRFDGLDVSHVKTGTQNDEVEQFMTTIIPSFVAYVSDVNLTSINNFVRLLLERHHCRWLTSSKVGLAILTMLLSRAEILKQGFGGAMNLDVSAWDDLYNFMFGNLQNHFAALFPTTVSHPPDEVYVWQFLASMAVSATLPDHQRILVTEVREKVIETAKRNDNPRALANVNLFLNALGLGIDASQLASLSV